LGALGRLFGAGRRPPEAGADPASTGAVRQASGPLPRLPSGADAGAAGPGESAAGAPGQAPARSDGSGS
jgi:hypothetical protein